MKNAYNAYRPINFNDGNIKINILRAFFHQQCQWTSLFTTISLLFITKFQIKFLFSEHFHFVSFGSSNFIGHKREFFVLFLWLVLLLLVMLLLFLVLFWPPFLVAVFISLFLISNLQSLLLDRINYFSSGVICSSNRNNNNNTATKQQPKQTIGERVPLWSLSYQRMAKIKHCT